MVRQCPANNVEGRSSLCLLGSPERAVLVGLGANQPSPDTSGDSCPLPGSIRLQKRSMWDLISEWLSMRLVLGGFHRLFLETWK